MSNETGTMVLNSISSVIVQLKFDYRFAWTGPIFWISSSNQARGTPNVHRDRWGIRGVARISTSPHSLARSEVSWSNQPILSFHSRNTTSCRDHFCSLGENEHLVEAVQIAKSRDSKQVQSFPLSLTGNAYDTLHLSATILVVAPELFLEHLSHGTLRIDWPIFDHNLPRTSDSFRAFVTFSSIFFPVTCIVHSPGCWKKPIDSVLLKNPFLV